MRNLFSKLALTAALVLAITFTFSCSGGDGGGGSGGEPSSDSGGSAKLCDGVEYDADKYRCESGELIGKCMGVDFYPAYQVCNNGIIEDKNGKSSSSTPPPPPSSNSTPSSSSVVISYCDYGPLKTQGGKVTGGCYPIGTATDQANCALPANNGSVVSSCPVTSGTFTDSRDSKTYKWVKIGTQTWMAENLNFSVTSAKCGTLNGTSTCTTYGALYSREAAKTVCPSGWHLPSQAEWDKLYHYVDGTSGTDECYASLTAGEYLKAKSGWDGTDDYGFAALPGGYGNYEGYYLSGDGYWWNSDEFYSANLGEMFYYYQFMRSDDGYTRCNSADGGVSFASVRCVKN